MKDCLSECGACEDCFEGEIQFECVPCEQEDCSLTLELSFSDGRYLRWKKLSDGKTGVVESSLGKAPEQHTTRVKGLAPEQAIAEALLF